MARKFMLSAIVAAFALVSGTLGMTRESRQAETEPLPPAWSYDLDVVDALS
jgi:hypothetical protein